MFIGDVIAIGELGVAFELVEAPRQSDIRTHDLQLVQTKIGVTLESVGALHPEAAFAWQALQDEPELAVQGAVRSFVRAGAWQVALYVLCCALQKWPRSAACMAQLANLYRRLAKRGMCGAGAARAAYRAAAQLYIALDRDAAAQLQALAAAAKEGSAEWSANEGATEEDESDMEAHEETVDDSQEVEQESPAAVAGLQQQRGAAQSGLLRLYRGWAGMEYSLGYVFVSTCGMFRI